VFGGSDICHYDNAMSNLPTNLYRAAQCRELDHLAIEEFGISGNILMERAGEAAFHVLRETWPEAKRIAVLCGVGNNGGDGYVIARLAHEHGLDVTVLQVGDAARLQGDALAALQRLQGDDVSPTTYAEQELTQYDVVVDSLLGTGLSGEVRNPFLLAINAINHSSIPVLAVDIPSGLNADTGMPCGLAVQADCTITFVGMKQGLLTGDAADYCGRIVFDDLKIPAAVYERIEPAATRLDYAELQRLLPPRKRATHKGDYGHVLIVGGNFGMTGAARLAGEAALRTGAGLVSIATRKEHAAIISSTRPELMSHGIENGEALKELSARASVIAIGPGLGQDDWAQEMLAMAVARNLPLIVDADALNLLAQIDMQRQQWILTPHPGEAARLLGNTTQAISNDRFAALGRLAEKYIATVVLKGAGTLVQTINDVPGVCGGGNPAMASGGMGDVLTGIIAGLIAQGLELTKATQFAVCLHRKAADLAIRGIGERGLLASDLMPSIRRLVNSA
jgi:NAD(P)H-hydrate epimerase